MKLPTDAAEAAREAADAAAAAAAATTGSEAEAALFDAMNARTAAEAAEATAATMAEAAIAAAMTELHIDGAVTSAGKEQEDGTIVESSVDATTGRLVTGTIGVDRKITGWLERRPCAR